MDINALTNYIIKYIEGGYYHPDMFSNPGDMGTSGETMYGMDRTGGSDIVNSEDGQNFWAIVDRFYGEHHNDSKYYNDKADGKRVPAYVGNELKRLATNMMLTRFYKYAKALDSNVYNLVIQDARLMLQFFYACWNGVGNFNTFAKVANDTYNSGKKDVGSIYNAINETRRNMPTTNETKKKLFRKGADQIDKICENHLGGVPVSISRKKIIWFVVAAIAGYVIYKAVKS